MIKVKVISDSSKIRFEKELEDFINRKDILLEHNPIYSTAAHTYSVEYTAFIKYELLKK